MVRASVDEFHHPRALRHAEGRTGRTFFERGFDYAALRHVLLDLPAERVPDGGVLVVDGIFTQRDELTAYWDLAVFLDVPFEVSVSRMARRDGSPDDVSDPDQARYVDGQRMYFARCRPWTRADVIVDNSNLNDPRILREVHHERAARPGGHRPRTVR